MGERKMLGYRSCEPGTTCDQSLSSLDSSPCPARQGDPCATEPPCPTWNEWSACSHTCGQGTSTRRCSGVGCHGASVKPCVVLAKCQQWSAWTAWSSCSSTCGAGERKRTRQCNGGYDCPGVSMVVETCASVPCPSWTSWGPWEACSVSCGQGYTRRSRKCQNGVACYGPAIESKVCIERSCPQWSTWTAWTTCSRSCDTGEMSRTRVCESGNCDGVYEEKLLCNLQDCPRWTEWTPWTVCANKCDEDNYRIRSRVCMYGGVAHTGCEGPAQDQSNCPIRSCPTWSDWGEWSECSTTCGQGSQARLRSCENGMTCPGTNREIRFCQLTSCPYWDHWMDWSGCSVTCGIGVCERRRRCIVDDLLNLPELEELDEASFEMDPVSEINSDKAKSVLIARSRSENAANRNYTSGVVAKRSPVRIRLDGEDTCIGSDVERKPCDAGPCCSWNKWTEWSPCIGCGSQAISKRSRICQVAGSEEAFYPRISSQLDFEDVHLPSDGIAGNSRTYSTDAIIPEVGYLKPIVPVNLRRNRRGAVSFQDREVQCCDGPSFETRICDAECKLTRSCEWTEWSEWCGCTQCQNGKEIRRRLCKHDNDFSNMQYSSPRCACVGADSEERECVVDRYCKSIQSDQSRSSSMHDLQQTSDQEQLETYVPISYRAEEVQTCWWSMWSEWSQCHNSERRQRKRFCSANDALISDCKCKGYHFEEEPCDQKTQSIQNVSESSSHLRAENEFSNNTDEFGANAYSKANDLYFPQNVVALSTGVTKNECGWTMWSQWSSCTATCDSGKRSRTRHCGCGENDCGDGSNEETSECSNWKCNGKEFPVFNVN